MREDTHVDTIIFKEYTNFQCSILELSHSKFFLCNWNSACKESYSVVSDSPALVDFAFRLVNSVLNLPEGQVMFF